MSADKPLILSVETSGTACGAALSEGGELIAEYSAFGQNMHDKLNAEFVRRILQDNSLSIDGLDAVAVSSGPGSFTGLRIGGSIAKGLCFENKPKLISVPTLSSYALAATEFAGYIGAVKIIAVIPSHKDLLYYQVFNNAAATEGEIVMAAIGDLREIQADKTVFCGPGAGLHGGGLAPAFLQTPKASFISALAVKLYERGKFTNAGDYEPVYVQEFTPKINRKTVL